LGHYYRPSLARPSPAASPGSSEPQLHYTTIRGAGQPKPLPGDAITAADVRSDSRSCLDRMHRTDRNLLSCTILHRHGLRAHQPNSLMQRAAPSTLGAATPLPVRPVPRLRARPAGDGRAPSRGDASGRRSPEETASRQPQPAPHYIRRAGAAGFTRPGARSARGWGPGAPSAPAAWHPVEAGREASIPEGAPEWSRS
jgi:hypothetical protein